MLRKGIDKKLVLNKAFNISDKAYLKKYPFITDLKNEIPKNTNRIQQIESMSLILNNYFNASWKEKGQDSIKLKRDFEKDIEKILFLIYDQNESEVKKEKKLQKSLDEINREKTTNKQANINKSYTEFLLKIKEFDFYDEKTNSLELTSFKINGRKALLLKHAYIILLIYWFEEILKNKNYLDSLNSNYYTKINDLFLDQNKISKQNWNFF